MKATIALALATPLLVAGALAIVPDSGRSAPADPPPATPAPPAMEAPKPPDRGPVFDEALLRPHFEKGDLRAARARFEAGLHEGAFQLFTRGDDGSPQVAFLRGLSALEIGRNEEAARILAPLPAKLPALADRIRWNLGLARERAGDFAGAAEAWGAITGDSVRHQEARLSRARALARLGKSDEALAVLAPLRKRPAPAWGTNYAAAAHFLAGELHLKRGEKDAARSAWLEVWSEHALSPQAEDAKQRADRLGGAGPTRAQQVARAQRFLGAHQNREGTDLIAALLPRLELPDPLACEARFALGRGYRKMREHSRAIPILEAVVASCKDPSVRARALYILGQSTTIVAPQKALGVYETLASEFADHSFADDALLFLAELHERAGNEKAARAALQRLVDGYPQGDYRADALFRLYWMDRKAGAERKAIDSLRILERDYADAADAVPLERSLYWQGRSLVALERPLEAAATWEKLIRDHPAGYYAMLARGRLARLDPDRAAAAEAALPHPEEENAPLVLHTGALEPDLHYQAALELIRLGFPKLAGDELLRIDREAARARAGGSPEPVLLVAWLLDRVESRRAAHHIARTELRELIRGRPTGESAAHFRIAYPLAFRDLIERHAGNYGVPADLMQALMREESSLDPQIVSWAGAIGLTQLMPSTARAVARQLKLGTPSNAQLRDPDLNVRIGTAYLGQLLKRWKGNPALATASYNAGPGAVSRWLGERGQLEMDEFVEEIPIEETRNYVKRVLDSFATYRLTYGSGEERFVALVPTRADGKAVH
ncbi:transglycosylase SLT domain-containing protein [Vulgatibacter sp.]|uniref:lytic transglycosylase domain-containing protein n=1 Tax=Vulgatibacter sp. TaxID=1971226 RepID=UPI003565B7D0